MVPLAKRQGLQGGRWSDRILHRKLTTKTGTSRCSSGRGSRCWWPDRSAVRPAPRCLASPRARSPYRSACPARAGWCRGPSCWAPPAVGRWRWGITRSGSQIVGSIFRVTHLLANLGWVDFEFGCSTLCLVLPGLMGKWQNWLSTWSRWGNIPNQSQPNQGLPGDGPPCI